MSSDQARLSTLPSIVVLDDLLCRHAGNPPRDALRQAGFQGCDVDAYLEQRAARATRAAWPCIED
jgi:hypothetical protein